MDTEAAMESHSTRVRGLKWSGINELTASVWVALYTSAWIEISDCLLSVLR